MRTLTLIVVVLCSALAASCNTIHGVGKDVEAAGKGIQRSTK